MDTHAAPVLTVLRVLADALALLWLGAMIAICAITAVVRKEVREVNTIRTRGLFAACPPVEDCCCGFCCTHCTQCLLLRQGITKGSYSLCSHDGDSPL